MRSVNDVEERRERGDAPLQLPRLLVIRQLTRFILHYAAVNGHRAMVDFLIARGANVNIKDTKVGSTPAGWADHGGHPQLRDYLEQTARRE